MGKRSRTKSIVMPVLVTILALTIATLGIVLLAYISSKPNTRPQRESYVSSNIINEIATESISLKINMENCKMEVGTKVKVTATIYPNGSTTGIVWTSSDPEVFTIDEQGNLEVVGTGIVALTATFGKASDSVAIECIETGDRSVLNLPDHSMFTGNEGNNSNNTGTTANNTAGNGSQNETTSGTVATSGTPAKTTAAQTTPVKTTAATTTAAATTKATTATTAASTTAAVKPTQTTPSYTLPTTQAYEGVKITSGEIAERLPDYGFEKYLDNTYVYQENDSYLGEVIISSNMTHIYIKNRTTGFDSALSSVLQEMLPESYEKVWNTYLGASTDQTMTVDGRMVRVVVSGANGHSQIVLYN